MAYVEHDLGPEGPARTPAGPVTTQRTSSGAGTTTAPLLDLQRLAGNAAVNQAIQSGVFDDALPVQRAGPGESEEDEEMDEEKLEEAQTVESDAEDELKEAEGEEEMAEGEASAELTEEEEEAEEKEE